MINVLETGKKNQNQDGRISELLKFCSSNTIDVICAPLIHPLAGMDWSAYSAFTVMD